MAKNGDIAKVERERMRRNLKKVPEEYDIICFNHTYAKINKKNDSNKQTLSNSSVNIASAITGNNINKAL